MQIQRHNRDCLQCCLSELLDVPYELVPEFYKLYSDSESESDIYCNRFTNAFDEWLNVMSLQRVVIDVQYINNAVKAPYFSNNMKMLAILSKPDRVYTHVVVCTVADDLITIDDPNPDSDYTIEDIIKLTLIFPTDAEQQTKE